jgi:hypothetical protein
VPALALVWLCASAVFPEAAAPLQQERATAQFDPRDLSGVWMLTEGTSAFEGFGPETRPPMTPQAVEIMRDRIPARSVPYPHLSNDPEHQCNPAGFPKLLFDSEPTELMQLDDRLLQVFQWEGRLRYIWLDGRELPSGENLDNLGPAWYGHSVGEWEGDTLVVNTTGLEERAWLDRPGNPKSLRARIEERYTMLDADNIEVLLTLYDPENYTAPWEATRRVYTRQPSEIYTFFGWQGIFSGITESICAPMDEVVGYNERFRDPSAPIE